MFDRHETARQLADLDEFPSIRERQKDFLMPSMSPLSVSRASRAAESVPGSFDVCLGDVDEDVAEIDDFLHELSR